MGITTKEIDGVTYYIMNSRGTTYTLYFDDFFKWCLHSKRDALTTYNVGTYRNFKSLDALEGSIKAFRGISQVIN